MGKTVAAKLAGSPDYPIWFAIQLVLFHLAAVAALIAWLRPRQPIQQNAGPRHQDPQD